MPFEYHEKALRIDREIGEPKAEGADLGNLGLDYEALDQVDKAIEYFQQHLDIARRIGDRLEKGTHWATWEMLTGELEITR